MGEKLQVLIALWRKLNHDGTDGCYPEDVAIEMQTTVGRGTKGRCKTVLGTLMQLGLVKKGQWPDSYTLSAEGKRTCAALEQMGLRREF